MTTPPQTVETISFLKLVPVRFSNSFLLHHTLSKFQNFLSIKSFESPLSDKDNMEKLNNFAEIGSINLIKCVILCLKFHEEKITAAVIIKVSSKLMFKIYVKQYHFFPRLLGGGGQLFLFLFPKFLKVTAFIEKNKKSMHRANYHEHKFGDFIRLKTLYW